MIKKKYIVSFSGGKDSTSMLLKMIEENYPIKEIIFFDTGWEFPRMLEHVKKVEKYINMPITKIYSKNNFTYTMNERPIIAKKGSMKGEVYRRGNGWPSHSRRWCTREKITCIDKHCGSETRCIGFAADEAHRKSKSLNAKKYNCIFPLIEWGMTEKDCLEYCTTKGFDWGGLYEIFNRVSCFCCPLQRIGDLRNLRKYFPELWEKMKRWEKKIEKNKGFRGYQSVQDLDMRFANEDKQGLFDFYN